MRALVEIKKSTMNSLHVILLLGFCIFGCESGGLRATVPIGQCPTSQKTMSDLEQAKAEVRAFMTGASYSCNGSPGWWKVASIDMADATQECPPGLAIRNTPIRTCASAHQQHAQCSSANFSVGGREYSKVCGRIRAYQFAEVRNFLNGIEYDGMTLEEPYVDGVSLTHGSPGNRQHIWTFSAGLYSGQVKSSIDRRYQCECDGSSQAPPSYVGQDYFCETGNDADASTNAFFFQNDPLWDGEGCDASSTCCDNTPWFTKTLPTPTTDDIELRLCHREVTAYADVPIDQIELYIKE